MNIFKPVVDHFRTSDSPEAEAYGQEKLFSFRNFIWILFVWLILWTVWPSLCIGNVAIDVSENIAWGDNFQFGYDKNPYFGAWLSCAVFRICPSEYVFYLMSQIAATLGLAAVYLLTFEATGRRFPAFVAGVSAMLIPFFSHSACEFNDDVMSIALWGWSALCFYRAVKRDSLKSWLAAGLFCGLALMTKYLAGALLLPLGLLLLITPEGRKCWKRPGLYLAGAVFLLLVLPNLIWLCKNNFIAISYALDRARLSEPTGWGKRLGYVLDIFGQFVSRLVLPAVALFIFRRGPKREQDPFGRKLILCAALGPFILSVLFILVTGGKVLTPWITPYFVFATPLLVLWYRPLPEPRNFKCFTGLMIVAATLFVAVFGFEYLHKRPYLRRGITYNVWPGRTVAEAVTREWRARYKTPLPYVIGDRTATCNVSFYSPDRPTSFFDHQVELSPWIDPADVERRGAVIVWTGDRPPYYVTKYYDGKLVMLPDITAEWAGVRWYRKLAGPLRTITVHAGFLPPKER
ncbi:MAG: glycosyltransferase family 39 protein [Lentisphaeria bacterium]|nr:glycosyltransferase family 39 protein [Lentisphaeria bacterium]